LLTQVGWHFLIACQPLQDEKLVLDLECKVAAKPNWY
jgi:hypothetical protein